MLPLRERRRQETRFQIQRATLKLAVQKGLETVTTEEIAAASGVSTRTFFNYYANKEAAAIGHPPVFSKEDKEALSLGTGPIAIDIKSILDRHIGVMAENEDILRMVGKILRSNEKARGILEEILSNERHEIAKCLVSRVNDHQVAAALAHTVTSAIADTIFLWEHEAGITLNAALESIWQGLISASRLLLEGASRKT